MIEVQSGGIDGVVSGRCKRPTGHHIEIDTVQAGVHARRFKVGLPSIISKDETVSQLGFVESAVSCESKVNRILTRLLPGFAPDNIPKTNTDEARRGEVVRPLSFLFDAKVHVEDDESDGRRRSESFVRVRFTSRW